MCKKGSSIYSNIAVLLLFISMIIGGCVLPAPPATAAPDQTVETEYVGRVIDVETQQPIAKAKITLDLEGVPPIVFTDSEGVYRFTVKIEAEIVGRVRVDAQGYEPYTRNITLSPDVKTIEDIRLTRLQSPVATASVSPTDSPVASATPTKAVVLPTSTSTVETGTNQDDTGWQGEYFDNTRFQEPPAYTRTDPAPIFDWKDGNPAPGIPIDQFSVRWTRCLTLEDRYYVFTARGDDNVKVYVDDIFVLEAGANDVERAFAVSGGQHCIKIEFVEAWNNASVYFDFWPGETYQKADESTAWKGEYFNNNRFQEPAVYTRNDPAPVFDWKDSNPAPGIPIDQFSVRWTRCLTLEDRYYIFTARGDDNIKVYVDDIFVLEAGANDVERAFAVSGGQHCIKIEFVEAWNNTSVYFEFTPGDTYQEADESTAWKGEYFNNNRFQEPAVYTRNDPAPVFNWKDSNPAPGIPIDQFSIRWTRCMVFENKEYVFTARGDDNVKVYVDNDFVLEAGANDVERAFAVAAGQHCIKIEFVEAWNNASVYFGFR